MDEFEAMWLDRKHIVSSSLCAPSIRTVVLALYHYPHHAAEEQEFDTEVFPVIAIESRIVETYTKRITNHKDYVDANLPRNILKQLGFRVRSREAEIRPIYAREEEAGLLISVDEHCKNTQLETVVCVWPPEEDEKKFHPIFERMKENAKFQADLDSKVEAAAKAKAQAK